MMSEEAQKPLPDHLKLVSLPNILEQELLTQFQQVFARYQKKIMEEPQFAADDQDSRSTTTRAIFNQLQSYFNTEAQSFPQGRMKGEETEGANVRALKTTALLLGELLDEDGQEIIPTKAIFDKCNASWEKLGGETDWIQVVRHLIRTPIASITSSQELRQLYLE